MELGFLMDSSASMNFYEAGKIQEMKNFVKNLTCAFNVSSTESRVGIVVYSTNASVALNLGQYLSYKEVFSAIDNITFPEGGRNTGKALKEAATNLFKSSTIRATVAKVLVIITDGVSTDDVMEPSSDIEEAGVTPFVVCIGANCDHVQLTQMALWNSRRVFSVPFGRLAQTVGSVRGVICLGNIKSFPGALFLRYICSKENKNYL